MKSKWYLLPVTVLVLVGLLSGCTPTQGQQSAVDAPANFSVEPGDEEGTAVVHFHFGPDFVSRVLVRMTQENGRWLISHIAKIAA